MAGSYDFEEQERIASIQHWWEDNAKFVYAAVAAFVLSVAGWKGWQYWTTVQNADAAAMEAELLRSRGDPKKSASLAQAVIDKHPRTFFASEAALISAQDAFESGDLALAQQRLEWVLANGRDEHKGVARLRLAAVLLDANKDEAWTAMVADLRGDILFSQGRVDEARAAYKLAIEKSDPRSPIRSLTELKLGALGGTQ